MIIVAASGLVVGCSLPSPVRTGTSPDLIHLPIPLRSDNPSAQGILVAAGRATFALVPSPGLSLEVELEENTPFRVMSAVKDSILGGTLGPPPFAFMRLFNGWVAGDSAWIEVYATPAGKGGCDPKYYPCNTSNVTPTLQYLCLALARDSTWNVVDKKRDFIRRGKLKPRCAR